MSQEEEDDVNLCGKSFHNVKHEKFQIGIQNKTPSSNSNNYVYILANLLNNQFI